MNSVVAFLRDCIHGLPPFRGSVLAIAAVLFLGLMDYLTGWQISFSIFYLLPIGWTGWYAGTRKGIWVAVVSAITWLVADLASGAQYSHPVIPLWNSLVRFGFFLIVVYLLSSIRRTHEDLESSVKQKADALAAEILERARVEREVLEISQREQQRIAHDLHDGLGTQLTALTLKASMLAEDMAAAELAGAGEAKELVRSLQGATAQARRLARGLDPIEVELNGILAALEKLAIETEHDSRITCVFKSNRAELRLSSTTSRHLYRIAQEAIHNAVKHSRAKRIEIDLALDTNGNRMIVADNGVGFSPDAQAQTGMGLRIMRYRAHVLGGSLKVKSAPNQGARVECFVPKQREREEK